MDDTNKATTKIWIIYGLIGFLLGACIIALSAIGLIAYESVNPPPTQTPLPTPTIAAKAILDQAYQMLNFDGEPQQALDMLEPHLEEFTDPDDLATALNYMGMAEIRLGHNQLAAVYFERMIQISPTPQNYSILARIYDGAGDLERALEYYLLYLKSDDPALTDDLRKFVQDRIDQIQLILIDVTPTSLP